MITIKADHSIESYLESAGLVICGDTAQVEGDYMTAIFNLAENEIEDIEAEIEAEREDARNANKEGDIETAAYSKAEIARLRAAKAAIWKTCKAIIKAAHKAGALTEDAVSELVAFDNLYTLAFNLVIRDESDDDTTMEEEAEAAEVVRATGASIPALTGALVRASVADRPMTATEALQTLKERRELTTAMLEPLNDVINFECFLRYAQLSAEKRQQFIDKLINHLETR